MPKTWNPPPVLTQEEIHQALARPLLTIREVAWLLNVTERSVERDWKKYGIERIQLSERVSRFTRESVDEAMARLREPDGYLKFPRPKPRRARKRLKPVS